MKNTVQVIREALQESVSVKKQIAGNEILLDAIANAAKCMSDAIRQGNTLYFCGNGGSAADAQHIAAELTGRFLKDREPIAADVLGINFSHITAVGNDYGFENIFYRDLKAKAKKGDILVAISTSGNSPNIMKAVCYANENGISVIGLTGNKGGLLREKADILLSIPSDFTPRIQESHITIGHIICELIELEIADI